MEHRRDVRGGDLRNIAVQPDGSVRPSFSAPICGVYFPTVPPIPKGVPPFFMELAQDDTLAGPQIILFYDALKAAEYKPELHLYERGWSTRKQGTTSDQWWSTSSIGGWKRTPQ